MKWRNDQKAWGAVTKIFHWGMLFLILVQYTLAFTMKSMTDSDQKWALYDWHKELGVTLFLIAFLRLWWREMNTVPQDSPKAPKWDHLLGRTNVYILYTLMFIFPLSGLLMSIFGGHPVDYFNLFTIPALMEGHNIYSWTFHKIHIWSVYIFAGLIGLHILGALFHHVFWKDNILSRMLPHSK